MRCIRAVQSLRAQEDSDMRVIALYTDEERDAPFVRHADKAVELYKAGMGHYICFSRRPAAATIVERCRPGKR